MALKAQTKGQSLIEVTVGIIVLVPALLVLLDLAVILYGVQLNDSVCRNAARAAASGDPADAKFRALTVITHANERANPPVLSNYELITPVDVHITSQPEFTKDETTGQKITPGGPVVGTATVVTQVEIRPFIVQHVYAAELPFKFRSQQTFPISYIMPPTAPPEQ